MPIKNIFNEKGAHSENADNDEVHFDVKYLRKGVQNFAPGTGGAITKPVAIFEGSVISVTGTLPAISNALVGLEIQVINANVAQAIQISASTGQPIDSAALTFAVAEEAAKFMAVSSSLDGFSWIVLNTKA